MVRPVVLCCPVFFLALAAAPLGCAADANGERTLDRMSREIDETQSRSFGLDEGADSGAPLASEAARDAPADPPPAAPPPAPPTLTPTPRLPVVHLARDGSEEDEREAAQPPRLHLTNANLPRPTHGPPGASPPPKNAKHAVDTKMASDAAPSGMTYPAPAAAPPAPTAHADRRPRPPAARPAENDEDNEHIVPVEEDNEHLVPVEEDNEHLVGGARK